MSKKFPNGWIGAEITVHNISYAVLRHIGTGNFQSRIVQSTSLESLIIESNKTPSKYNVSQESYVSKLGLNTPYSFDNPRCTEDTDWLQVLAWCSRDQESRYKSLYSWRDPESFSKTPIFSSAKEGPLYVIRYLLGFINEEETRLERENLNIQRSIEFKRVRLKNLETIPKIQASLLTNELKKLITKIVPDVNFSAKKILNSPEELPNIEDSIENDIKEGGLLNEEYKKKLNNIGERKYRIKESLDVLAEEYRQLKNKKDKYTLSLSVNKTKREQSKSSDDKFLEEYEAKKTCECTLGGCIIENCTYVIDKKDEIDSRTLNNKSFNKYRSDLNETDKNILNTIKDLDSHIERIKEEKKSLEAEDHEITEKKVQISLLWTRIIEIIYELKKYSKEIANPSENIEFKYI